MDCYVTMVCAPLPSINAIGQPLICLTCPPHRIPLVFTVFSQRELQCNSAGNYDVTDTLRTFMSAGSVAGVNCVSMLAFTEILINLDHPKWRPIKKADRYVIALLCLLVFWVWHAVVLYWVAQSFVAGTIGIGVFIGIHISTYCLTTAFAMTIR